MQLAPGAETDRQVDCRQSILGLGELTLGTLLRTWSASRLDDATTALIVDIEP